MNEQKPWPRFNAPDGHLQVFKIFRTIQGEGPLVGTPAVFVRLAGCILQCPWCDTDYTSTSMEWSVSQVIDLIERTGREDRLVVITGGEPFRQNPVPLIRQLLLEGYKVQVETNGVKIPKDLPWDDSSFCVVCSPKISVDPQLQARGLIGRVFWKYVLEAGYIGVDGLPTRALGNDRPPGRPNHPGAEVFVQPMDSGNEEQNRLNLEAAIESCRGHGYRLCLQTHKIAGLE